MIARAASAARRWVAAAAAAAALTLAACAAPEAPCGDVGHSHCCTDCLSATCVACCQFYGGCCGG